MTDIIVGGGVSSSSLTISAGDTLQVLAGGSATSMNILLSGTMSVSAGGSASSNMVAGTIEVGGVTTATMVQVGGIETILGGGVARNTLLATNADSNNYATEYVQPGGLAVGTQNDGDYVLVANGGITSGTHEYYDGSDPNNTGLERVTGGGSAYDSIVDNLGVLDVNGGASFRTQVNSGGIETVEAGGTASGSVVGSGGSQIVFNGGTITGDGTDAGTVVLSAGATFTGTETLAGSAGGPALFEFAATVTGTQDGVISGYTYGTDGNQIEFGGYDSGATVTTADGNVTVSENGNSLTVNIAGVTAGESLTLDDNGFLLCFLAGTHILAQGGERRVERLRAGDLVATVQNGRQILQPVRWIGHRSIKINGRTPDAFPVRIRAGAFADGVPHRDLLITQEHCIFVAGKLIPARMLVNGRSIIIDRAINSFTCYHVELEQHGILLAEGLTAESYLDTGNRGNFVNADMAALRPDFAVNSGHKNWADHAAAPLAVARAVVEPVWQSLKDRAEQMRFPTAFQAPAITEDPGLHLSTGSGQKLWPVSTAGNRYFFRLPPNSSGVRLNSLTFRPSDSIGPFVDDRRTLGVLVGALVVWSGRKARTVDLDASLQGWLGRNITAQRWTDGSAELPISTAGQAALIEVEVLAAGPYLLEATDLAGLARCA